MEEKDVWWVFGKVFEGHTLGKPRGLFEMYTRL